MVLLQPVVQVATVPVPHILAQLGPDRAGVENALTPEGLDALSAQKLIGRTIFSQYLADRRLLPPARLRELFGADTLPQILCDASAANRLFAWMKATFNGDLFPYDVPGEESGITPSHLLILADFLRGFEISTGQWRVFPFRFDVMPVELISSIYEQFAHSIAGKDAAAQGLHYTPTNLVDLMLDTVMDGLPAEGRVLRPGMWVRSISRRSVPTHRLAPIAECAVQSCDGARCPLQPNLWRGYQPWCAPSNSIQLVLSCTELDPDLSEDFEWLKFKHLIGRTLHLGSFFNSQVFPGQRFHAIIGNPPWTYVRREEDTSHEVSLPDVVQPRRTPDWAFIWRASGFRAPRRSGGFSYEGDTFLQ